MNSGRRTLGLVSQQGFGGQNITWESGTVTYLTPNSFQVTGRDARNDYRFGVVSIGGELSGVHQVQYSGGNTVVFVRDAVCFSGMPSVGIIKSGLGPDMAAAATITPATSAQGQSASALNDGDYSTGYGFNSGGSGTDYIQVQLTSAALIRWISIEFIGYPFVSMPTSFTLSYSDNGSSYTLHQTLTPEANSSRENLFVFSPPASPHVYWKMVFSGQATVWYIMNIMMGQGG